MPRVVPQAAVLPVREGLVCLVTSSNGARWVIPKGMIDPGHNAIEAATIEAWEEAGLIGTVSPVSLGEFEYRKRGQDHRVAVYLMTVTDAKTEWPEAGLRRREWVTIQEAILRVEEPGLRDILREWAERSTTVEVETR